MSALCPRVRIARALALLAIRALVLVLALPLASAQLLPVLASLVGGEASHVCHCSRDHHECACPRCHTDAPSPTLLTSDVVSGRCGDEDMAAPGKTIIGVAAPCAATIAAPAPSGLAPDVLLVECASHDRAAPPTPPPRSIA